jgi:hypothetical protein
MVRRAEAWWQHAGQGQVRLSASTSAYWQARARLDPNALELICGHLCWSPERNVLSDERWLASRPVKIIDGTGLSRPDTAANQALWPPPSLQGPSLGFPMRKLIGLFSLARGALLESPTGNLHVHESGLFRALWDKLQKGDVVLADRGFCSYGALAALQQRGVDSVMRLHQMRRADFRTGRALLSGGSGITGKSSTG